MGLKVDGEPNQVIPMKDLPPGKLGVIVNKGFGRRIVQRAYGYTGVFQILGMHDQYQDPSDTLEVRVLKPGETLVVTDEQ